MAVYVLVFYLMTNSILRTKTGLDHQLLFGKGAHAPPLKAQLEA